MLDINSLLGFQPKTLQISEVVLVGGEGLGSVGSNAIQNFATLKVNRGGAITWTKNDSYGDTFTINENGLYWISYRQVASGGTSTLGITRNQTNLEINAGSMGYPILLAAGSFSAGFSGNPTAMEYLLQGDIIRASAAGSGLATAANDVAFQIIQLVRT